MSLTTLKQFHQQYEIQKKIAQGSYGMVSRVRQKEDGKLYAFKKIIIHRQENILGIAINQILSQTMLKHQLVVKLFKFYIQQRQFGMLKSGTQLGLIMELGLYSLEKFIADRNKKSGQCVPLKYLQTFACQFIELFSEMQLQNKCHRDIKPANFIVFDEAKLQCKLTDFGFCQEISHKISSVGQPAGSFFYMSPKLKEKSDNPTKQITSNKIKDDVYSFGVTLYELAYLRHPDFNNLAFNRLRERYNHAKLIDIIELMMEKNQNKRPTFLDLRQMMTKLDQKRPIEPVIFSDEVPKQLEQEIGSLRRDDSQLESKPYTIHPAETKLPIHSMCIYEDIIFVGTQKGQVKVLRNEKIFMLPKSHTNSVQVLEIIGDEVWSAGCDSKIFIWDCKLIKQEINDNKSTLTMSQNSLFHEERTVETNVIQNDQVRREKKNIPFHKEGISSILYSQNGLLAIGYYKGQLYVSFNGEQKQVYAHDGMISLLKQKDNLLYSSGADGMLKCFDLTKMQLDSIFFRTTSPIIGFQFFKQQISIVCMTGIVEIVSYDLWRVCESKRVSQSDIYSCCFSSTHNLILNEEGEVFDNERRIARLECRGPNCIRILGELIVITSFKGHVIHIFP